MNARFLLLLRCWLVALTIATAGLSAYSVAMQNQKFGVDSADLAFRWNRLCSEFESIWENVEAEDACERLQRLTEKTAELSKTGSAFRYEKRRMLKWQDHVEAHRLPRANAA